MIFLQAKSGLICCVFRCSSDNRYSSQADDDSEYDRCQYIRWKMDKQIQS